MQMSLVSEYVTVAAAAENSRATVRWHSKFHRKFSFCAIFSRSGGETESLKENSQKKRKKKQIIINKTRRKETAHLPFDKVKKIKC